MYNLAVYFRRFSLVDRIRILYMLLLELFVGRKCIGIFVTGVFFGGDRL